MKTFKELWPLVVSIVGGIAAVIGAAFGQGFVSSAIIGLSVSGALYWLSVTSLGLLLARWPMELLMRFKKDVPPHAVGYVPTNLQVMWSFPVWVIAFIAVIVAAFVVDLDGPELLRYGCIVALQGFFGAVLLMIRRRLRFAASPIMLLNWDSVRATRHARDLRAIGYVLFAFWIVAPFVFASNQGALADAGFRMTGLRKDHAIVHVAAPWDRLLVGSGLQKQDSFLGPTHSCFADVTVRSQSIGSRVVLEIPSQTDGPRRINIPRQFVEIE